MSFGSEFAAGFSSGMQLAMRSREMAENRAQRKEEFEWRKGVTEENQRINREVHHVLSPEDAEKERKLKEKLPGGGDGGTGAVTTAAPGTKASGSSGGFLDTLAQVESGNRNIPSGVDPDVAGPGTKSQGYFQINTPTWRDFAGRAGVSLNQYPNAMSAPRDVQARVASVIPFARFGPRTQKMMRAKYGDFSSRETVGALASRFGGGLPSSAGTKIAAPAVAPAVAPTQATPPARAPGVAPGDTTDTQAGQGDLDAIMANETSSPELKAWAKREKARLYPVQQASLNQPDYADYQDVEPEPASDEEDTAYAAEGGAIPRRYEPGGRVSGNIDVRDQPRVPHQGKTATVNSMSFGEDGREVLIPRVSQSQQRVLEPDEAIDEYHQTGRHLGQFPTQDEADEYAQGLHQREEERTMAPAIPPRQKRKYAPGGTVDYYAQGASGAPWSPTVGNTQAGGWQPRHVGDAPAEYGPQAAAAPALATPAAPKAATKPKGTSLMQGPGKGQFSWSGQSRFEEKVPTVQGWGANSLKNLTDAQLQSFIQRGAVTPNDPRGMFASGFGPASWAFGVGTRMTPEQSQQMQDYARYRVGEYGVHNAYSLADQERAQSAIYQAQRQPQGDRSGAQYSGRAKGGPINRGMGAIPGRKRTGTHTPPMGQGSTIPQKVKYFAAGGSASKTKKVEKDTGLPVADYDPNDFEPPTLQPNISKGGRAYGGPYSIPRQEDIGWGVDMVTPAQARARERRAELAAFRGDQLDQTDSTEVGVNPMLATLSQTGGGMGGMSGMGGMMPGMAWGQQGVPVGQPAPGAGSVHGYRAFAPGGAVAPEDPQYGTTTGVMQSSFRNEDTEADPNAPWQPRHVGQRPTEYGPAAPPPPPFEPAKPKTAAPSTGLQYMGEHAPGPSATGGAYGLPASTYGGPVYKSKSGALFSDEEGKWAIPASAGLHYAEGGGVPQGSFGGGAGGGTGSRMDWRNYWDQPPEFYRAGPGGSEAQHGEVEQINARRRGPARAAPAQGTKQAEGPSQGSPNAGDPGLRRPYDTPTATTGIPEGPQVGQNLPQERADKKLEGDAAPAPVTVPEPSKPVVSEPELGTPAGSGRKPERSTPLKDEPAIPPRGTTTTKPKKTPPAKGESAAQKAYRQFTDYLNSDPEYLRRLEEGESEETLYEEWKKRAGPNIGIPEERTDVGTTGSIDATTLGPSRGITVGGPLALERATDPGSGDPNDPNGFFQVRRATGLARGGAIPSRYAPGGPVNDNEAAQQRLRARAAARVGLTEGDLARAQSDPSRYGPYFFEGDGRGAPTAAIPGRRGQPSVGGAKPGQTAQPQRAPTGPHPAKPSRGGIPEGPQVGQEVHDEGPRYIEKPRVDLNAVPLSDDQNLRPVGPLDSERVPEAPHSYVQQPNEPLPRPYHEAYQPIPNTPQGPLGPQATRQDQPYPRVQLPVPPGRGDEARRLDPPPATVNTEPRAGISSPGFFPSPGGGGPSPPRVDPQRTERPPRQVRQIDTRAQPAMGWVYVLGPNGQPTQVPRNAAHLYPPLPPEAVQQPPLADVRSRKAPRPTPAFPQGAFPESPARPPPRPARYAPGGPVMTEQDMLLQQSDPSRYGAPEAAAPPMAIPSRAGAMASPFAQPAPASQPAAGAAPAQAQPQQQPAPTASPQQQDAIVNPNREINPALPSFVNGLRWFEGKVRDLIDGSHDPRAQLALQDIAHGDGAPQLGIETMTGQEVKQVENAVDPKGQLDPAQRNILAYQEIYDFYIAHDQPEKAAATAMALTNYNKRYTQQAGAMSLAALKAGDIETSVKWLDKAYERIPDYKDLTYKINPDGTVSYAIIDRMHNKELESGTLDKQSLASMAMQMQTGGLFDQRMGENMKEVAAWRGRRLPGEDKPEKPPNEAALKRADNREVTTAVDAGVIAGKKGDEAGIMEAARKVYDHMGHTEEAMKVIDRMFTDAGMEPPASIQRERDAHPIKDPNDPHTQKDRDTAAREETRKKLVTQVQAAGNDPAKRDPAARAYADQAYDWAAENRPPPNTEMMSAMPTDIQETDPLYNPIKTGAFLILKRNDIDPGYATAFMKAFLNPATPVAVLGDGRVHAGNMTYPLFIPKAVFEERDKFINAPKKAA